MELRTATALLLLAAVSVSAPKVHSQDLEPEEGVFAGYSPPSPYELILRAALLGDEGYRLCQLVVLPSFESESSVYMVREEKPQSTFKVFSRTMRKSVWTEMMQELEKASGGKPFSMDATFQTMALEKLRKAVDVRSAVLDARTGNRLDRICGRVLQRVRYAQKSPQKYPQKFIVHSDGTVYHAGHWRPGAFLAGKTWSPEKGTFAGNFVELTLTLKRYAEAAEPQRAAAKDTLNLIAERLEGQLEAATVVEPAN